MSIFLIGCRGSGKSSVGRRLAERLGWAFVDADAEIESRAGRSIAAIFADAGEAEFRRLETEVVADLARRVGAVVALGGGAVLREENRRALREAAGSVVWLVVRPETAVARIAADAASRTQRPALTDAADPLDEMRRVLAEREPLYRRCADRLLDADERSADELAEALAAVLALPADCPPAD